MKRTFISLSQLRFSGFLIVFLSLSLAFLLTGGHSDYAKAADGEKGVSSGNPTNNYGKRYSNEILQGVKLNDVFTFNDTNTTPYMTPNTPAYANIWSTAANFLSCTPPSGRPFSYALCYYSGPDYPTGNPTADNPPLPCTLSPDGVVANCTCYEISTELDAPMLPYYVDINAISNLDIYQETVEACGETGANCFRNGRIPPVCEAINTNLLVPGADLISVFSPAYISDYQAPGGDTSTDCRDDDARVYAGCMTAPCYRTGEKDEAGRDLVECKCPVYDGDFQVGQGGQSCNANDPPASDTFAQGKSRHDGGNNVWSAAFNEAGGPIIITDAECIPDSPQKGCPLFNDPPPAQGYKIDPDGVLCQSVCEHYENSTPSGVNNGNEIQVGYSCDATLCTTFGIGQADSFIPPAPSVRNRLLGEACEGIINIKGLTEITLVEELAKCSCCASQVCGCNNINDPTNEKITILNVEQRLNGIKPQCDINKTLCGT